MAEREAFVCKKFANASQLKSEFPDFWSLPVREDSDLVILNSCAGRELANTMEAMKKSFFTATSHRRFS